MITLWKIVEDQARRIHVLATGMPLLERSFEKGRWCTCLPEGGRSGASPEPLYDDPSATNGFRASGRRHLIKDRRADGSLRLLRGETVCAQPRPDQCLVPAHRRFDERALAVVGGGLPGESSSFSDHFQMVITLCRLIRFGWAQPSSAMESPRRCHRRASRSFSKWRHRHMRHPPSPEQSGRQFD
jgi:hypothetical protein